MPLKIWMDFTIGDRVMAGDCQRDIGTILELKSSCDVAGRALVRWDDGADSSWIRADMLKPSPHIEDDDWEYLLNLLLDGEIDTTNFRQQAMGAGYMVDQINNAIDYNWQDIRDMMVPVAA